MHVINLYKQSLEKLYTDTADIHRYIEHKDKELGSWVQTDKLLFSNIKCRISQINLSSNNQSYAANSIEYSSKLFLSPDIDIKQGDKIIVKRNHITKKYIAGEPFIYSTHQEVLLKRKEWA